MCNIFLIMNHAGAMMHIAMVIVRPSMTPLSCCWAFPVSASRSSAKRTR